MGTEEGRHPVDHARAEAAVRELLIAVGENPDRDGLIETPARVARAYGEFFAGLSLDAAEVLSKTFEIEHEEMILVRDIEVYSMCEHHLVPFHGVAHVGYIPGKDGRVTGLSKMARLVEMYARRPQVQERLTGLIKNHRVQILIDGGSTHNFLQHELVSSLQLSPQDTSTLRVTVGNGE